MATSPVLNDDILMEVLRACPRSDCSRFMRTSRFFYMHGFKTLLSDTVDLATEEDVSRFFSYLSKPEGARFQSVRSLHFDLSVDLKEEAARALTVALPSLSNLDELSISCVEDFLSSDAGLSDALAMLTSIRNIRLSYIGPLALKMLQSLRSKLVSATLGFDSNFNEDEGFFDLLPLEEWPTYHPTVLLAHSQSTLEVLVSYRWDTDPDIIPRPTIVYPKMYRLHLERPLLPLSVSLIRAYPNLAQLLLFDSVPRHSSSNHLRYSDRRSLNISQQEVSGTTWEELGKYRGTLVDLYMLGLTCPIAEVDLLDWQGEALYMLDPVLFDARPRRLTLKQRSWELEDSGADPFAVFRGRGGTRLEFLHVAFGVGHYERAGDFDVAAALENLLSSVRSAPLQDLQLRVVTTSLDPRPYTHSEIEQFKRKMLSLPTPPALDTDDYPLLFAERSANAFDLENYMQRFTRGIPTLKHAEITMIGPRDSWRRVVLIDGQPLLQERFVRRRRMNPGETLDTEP